MNKIIAGALVAALFLIIIFGLFKGPDYLQIRYDELLKQAQQHCNDNKGDVFRPYGFAGWMALTVGKPRVFKCYRYRKILNKTIAIYVIEGSTVDKMTLEIR